MTSAEQQRGCDYCGLPLPRRAAGARQQGPAYCCFGCRFAAAVAEETGEEGHARWTLARLGISVFFAMNVMVFSMAMWSQDVYGSAETVGASESAQSLFGLFRWLALLFATPVLLLLGGPLLENALLALRQRSLSTDLLLVAGVTAAFLLSLRAVWAGSGPIYFEVACVVLVAVTLGRWLEATGKLKTTQALRGLSRLLPETVRRVQWIVPASPPAVTAISLGDRPPPMDATSPSQWAERSIESPVRLEAVSVGDLLRVLPGERIPVDGVIRRNHAAIDEQLVTGESQPAVKEPGDAVLAGSLNLDGDLLIEVTADPGRGTLQRLIEAVCQAAMAQSRLQRMADRVSAIFIPLVFLLALGTFAWHMYDSGLEQGVLTGLAVILIACPCALGIATPMALWAAMGNAARAGVLFRNGDALQRLAMVRTICFDKTGTLTTGECQVVDFAADESTSPATVLAAAHSLASASNHGLSCAVLQYVHEQGPASLECAEGRALPASVRTRPGRGLQGAVAGVADCVYLGSERLMREMRLRAATPLEGVIDRAREQGLSFVCLGWDGRVRGVFLLREQLRDEAIAAVKQLRESELAVAVLTGDHAGRGAALQRSLSVPVTAELLPDDKSVAIRRLRQQQGLVAMVGDGINDAPALASADVGIALGCGADVSRDAADVCLLGDDLLRVPWAIALARRTLRTIYYNLFWAFVYNVMGIAIAVAGWLNPIWAAAAMVVSSLLVVSNSLRLAGGPSEEKLAYHV